MSSSLTIILPAALLFALVSCSTTGDPKKGGLFGWSERKARDDTAEMQRHLDNLESNSSSQQTRSRTLEQQAAEKQRELDALKQ